MFLRLLYWFVTTTVSLSFTKSFSQNNYTKDYVRHIDSAFLKIDNKPKLALQFLDSIPMPLEKHIEGHLAEYYNVKALAYESFNVEEKLFENYLLALQFAEKEDNYNIAADASFELFYNLYIIKEDSTAFSYLNKAENYYKKTKNKFGLLDVMQMEAFIELHNNNYKKSIALILPKLSYYKSIKEDAYYYMYPLFMLTSSYIHLNDKPNSKKYYALFKGLQNDSTIPSRLLKKHDVTLLICMAEMHLKYKELDSAKLFLSRAGKLRQYMNSLDVKNYFNDYIEYYKIKGNVKHQQRFVDSLGMFQNTLIDKAKEANFNISQNLAKTNKDLTIETTKKTLNRIWVIALVALLLVLTVFIVLRHQQAKGKFKEFSKQKKDFDYLESNQEKLQAKIQGFKSYILEVKNEVKEISNNKDTTDQQTRIKELYKKIYHSSATLLSTGKSHLELINSLNVDFFNNLSTQHPQLNHSELILCYYIFSGFKNKEIAVFLNTSVRAVENKRFRISKKIKLETAKTPLHHYLIKNFSAT